MKKLTKEQFVNETLAIYTHVFHEMNTMLDKYPEINADFEKELGALHKSSMDQMIEYAKALAEKDEKTKHLYLTESLLVMARAMEKEQLEAEMFEKKFDDRMPELMAYGGEVFGMYYKDLFGITDYMDIDEIKEYHPKIAKEYGIE